MHRNGGVPQEGNLTLHLENFRKHLDEQINDINFNGIGIIDFESWRPIFRQNWASLLKYKELSYSIEENKHYFWPKKLIKIEAEKNFEYYGKLFMDETLKLAKKLRPYAYWGYYAYPYCFNWTPKQQKTSCSPQIVEENNR